MAPYFRAVSQAIESTHTQTHSHIQCIQTDTLFFLSAASHSCKIKTVICSQGALQEKLKETSDFALFTSQLTVVSPQCTEELRDAVLIGTINTPASRAIPTGRAMLRLSIIASPTPIEMILEELARRRPHVLCRGRCPTRTRHHKLNPLADTAKLTILLANGKDG